VRPLRTVRDNARSAYLSHQTFYCLRSHDEVCIVANEGDAAAVVRAHVSAFNRADASLVAEGFHLDARFCTGRDVVVEGRSALESFFRRAFGALALHLTVEQLVADEGRVAVQMRERVIDGGVESEEYIAAFYDVEDGLLRSAKVYREGSATG
jgi:uncharacterized protein